MREWIKHFLLQQLKWIGYSFVSFEEHESLKEKTQEVIDQRNAYIEKFAKYQKWEDSPWDVLHHFLPNLKFTEDFQKEFFANLSAEDKAGFLEEMHRITKTEWLFQEFNVILQGIGYDIVKEDDSTKQHGMRQLFLFLLDLRERIENYAVQYEDLRRKKNVEDPHRIT